MARPRARDFEEKQTNLLLVAAKVFATHGMEKTSMSQIASIAGVSKSLLYHYHPSKGELIFAIIHSHLETLDGALAAADDPNRDPETRLGVLVATVLDVYDGADDQHQVQLNAGEALNEGQKARITALERRIVARFSRVFADLRPDLASAERPLLMPVTMSLFGMLNWVYLWFRDDGPITRAEYARIATTLILRGVGGLR